MLVRSCTQEQYDALSEEEKRGLFVITDANSGGGPNETVYEWWSPEMTSDNTPVPYTAAASSHFNYQGIAYKPYCAFDGVQDSCWHVDVIPSSGVSLDDNPTLIFSFGSSVSLSGLAIRPRTGFANEAPIQFSMHVSNDGNSWEAAFTIDSASYTDGKFTEFEFNSVHASFFKLTDMRSGYPGSNKTISISEIKFYKSKRDGSAEVAT